MMDQPQNRHHVLITGATGLIGHQLLARLLARGVRCAAVVRHPQRDAERLKNLLEPLGVDAAAAFAQERLVLLRGDLPAELDAPAELRISDIVHLAGCTRFHLNADGDPARTNVHGTQRLLEWASQHKIPRLHLASTAYAGGRSSEVVSESPLTLAANFNNDYERSKWMCERLCAEWAQQAVNRRLTVMRPSIVVGEWASGRSTSFGGLYLALRAVQAAANMVQRPSPSLRARLDLRIPGRVGSEQNIVPVDYVAEMMASIVRSSVHHGGIFNLVHPAPPSNGAIRRALETVLDVRGLVFEDERPATAPRSAMERIFDRLVDPICPYLRHSPRFTRSRTADVESRAGIRCPAFDEAALVRMCAFAVDARRTCEADRPAAALAERAAEYFERFLPQQVKKSAVGRAIALTADVRFTLTDIADGAWLCRFNGGQLTSVLRCGNGMKEDFGYRVDAATFLNVVAARTDPREAFLSGHVEFVGDVERALKMAMVLQQFSAEQPFHSDGDVPR